MKITVVIAFRGDEALLRWALEGFARQQLASPDQVTVAVGGDGQDLPALPPGTAQVRFIGQRFERMGAAAVRNELARLHPADVLIFGNADARPEEAMVRTHIERLNALPAHHMVLGAAPWDVPASPTVFDALLAETPMVFFYNKLRRGEHYDFRHAWTLNLSARYDDFIAAGGFNPLLRPVYYEDLALGLRVCGPTDKNILYEPAAKVLHRHPTTLEQYLNREELLGLMAPVLFKHEPQAFAAIFGDAAADALGAQFRHWVTLDMPMHRFAFERLSAWARKPAQVLPTDAAARDELLMTIYQMHVPLKRLAFRLGFLRGLELLDPADWTARTPAGLWRKVLGV